MKGIYLTEQGKQELEAKIAELEEKRNQDKADFDWDRGNLRELNIYKEILSSATILPVEENWGIVEKQTNMMDEHQLRLIYDKGVIIQPKQ